MNSPKWERVQELLEAYLGHADPDDPKERKRRRIIAASTALFLQHGYRKTSVGQIAHEAHVAKGTVYLYFKSKAEILLHAIAFEKSRHMGEIATIFEDGLTREERLRRYVRLSLVLSVKMPLVSRLNQGDREILMVMDELDADVKADNEALQLEMLSGFLSPFAAERGWSEADVQRQGWALISLMLASGQLMDARVRHGVPLEQWAEVLSEMVVSGLLPRGGDR